MPACYLKICDLHCFYCAYRFAEDINLHEFKYTSLTATCYGKDFVFLLGLQDDFSLVILHTFSRETAHTCPLEIEDTILP